MLPEAVGVSIFELLSQLDEFQFERGKSIGGRIRHIGMVHGRIGEPLPLRLDDPGRHPDHRRIGGNRLQDDGIRADFHVVADRNPAEDLRPRPDDHMAAERGMALAALLPRSTKRHALKQGDVVSDLSRFSDHHTHAVIDKKSLTDLGGRMDLDSRQPAGQLGNRAGQERHTMPLQPMCEPIGQQSVKSRISRNDFEPAGGGRIPVKNRLEVLRDSLEHRWYQTRERTSE